MSNNTIQVTKITEHEDGSATIGVDIDGEPFRKIFEYGLIMLLIKAVEDAEGEQDE